MARSLPTTVEDLFDLAWAAYPAKGQIKRVDAQRRFAEVFGPWDEAKRQQEIEALLEAICEGGKWATSKAWDGGYVPGFGEFIRNMRWKENPEQAEDGGAY